KNLQSWQPFEDCIANVLSKEFMAPAFAGSELVRFVYPQLALWAGRMSPATLASSQLLYCTVMFRAFLRTSPMVSSGSLAPVRGAIHFFSFWMISINSFLSAAVGCHVWNSCL